MKNDILNLEVRFLLARYGVREVLQSLATLRHQNIEQLEAELADLEASRTARRPKRLKTGEELVAELASAADPRRAILEEAVRLFEVKRWLPNLADVQDFVLRTAGEPCKSRSRREALRTVLCALLELPASDARRLLEESATTRTTGDYELLATQIMAGR